MTVRGHWDGQRLSISESRPAASAEWTTRLTQVVIETRVRQHEEGREIRTGRSDVDAALARRGDQEDSNHLNVGTLIRMTARLDADGKLHLIRIERAENKLRKELDGDPRSGGKDGAHRASKEAREAAKEQEKRLEQSQHAEHDQVDRGERVKRTERLGRAERPERVYRSRRNQ